MELVIDPALAGLAENSSDEGASSGSEDEFDEPEVEVVKPRVHHQAVLDPLGRSLVTTAENSVELEQQVTAPKTAEELADAAELAERQRGRSGRRGSVVEFAGRRAAMSEEAQLEATAARLRRARASNDANEMQSALTAAAPTALMQGSYVHHPHSSRIPDAAQALRSMLFVIGCQDGKRGSVPGDGHCGAVGIRRGFGPVWEPAQVGTGTRKSAAVVAAYGGRDAAGGTD
jgi:hypothetical protein